MNQLTRRQFVASTAAVGASLSLSSPSFALANDSINMGFISCGGRAGEHLRRFGGMADVNVCLLYTSPSPRDIS